MALHCLYSSATSSVRTSLTHSTRTTSSFQCYSEQHAFNHSMDPLLLELLNRSLGPVCSNEAHFLPPDSPTIYRAYGVPGGHLIIQSLNVRGSATCLCAEVSIRSKGNADDVSAYHAEFWSASLVNVIVPGLGEFCVASVGSSRTTGTGLMKHNPCFFSLLM